MAYPVIMQDPVLIRLLGFSTDYVGFSTSTAKEIKNFASVFSTKDDFSYDHHLIDWSPAVSPMRTSNEQNKLDIRKSTREGVFVPRLYRAAAYGLSDTITHLLNDSMLTSTVPAKWKCAHVIPILKTTVPQLTNLQPISL